MTYTRAQLETRINAGIQGKIGMLISSEDTMNEAVRNVLSKVDVRTTRRRATLTPSFNNGVYQYTSPTDLKDFSVIDITTQASDQRQDGEWRLVPSEFFELNKTKKNTMISVDDYNGQRVLLLNSVIDSDTHVFSTLDSTTAGGGTWSAFGDAENLAQDTDNFIKGNAALKFAIDASGGTTAGIENSSLNSFDMTDYFGGNSSFFVWTKITDTTNITNYILRFGTESSNYYSQTVTAQADGTAFVNGWNLLKFDVASYSTTGTPTNTDIKYVVAYMTKDATKVSETNYMFDHIVLKRGVTSYVKYYSKYGWKTNAGVYIENSTATTDILLADTDEFDLFVKEGRVLAAYEVGLTDTEIAKLEKRRDDAIENYKMRYPSEAKNMEYDYYDF